MMWIWLSIVVLLSFIEIITINLTTIWFVASASVALVLSFFVDSIFIQSLVFVLGGLVLLVSTRKYLIKLLGAKSYKTNLDRVIGMSGIVTESISKNHPGEVKVDGKRWTAISDKDIEIDSTVRVLEISGVKLKVEEEIK